MKRGALALGWLLLGASLASAGCLSADEGPRTYAVTVETSYDPQQTAQEDRGEGPGEGEPATGGELHVHVVEQEKRDGYRKQLEGGLFDPPAPREVEEGSVLRLPSNRSSERYLVPLGPDGRAASEVQSEVPVVLFVDMEGRHPNPPQDCELFYVNEDIPDWSLPAEAPLTVPYGIGC